MNHGLIRGDSASDCRPPSRSDVNRLQAMVILSICAIARSSQVLQVLLEVV